MREREVSGWRTNHGGEADELDDKEGANGEEDSSCSAENIVEDLRDGLRNRALEDSGRVALEKISFCRFYD